MDVLSKAVPFFILIFVVSSMLALGFSLTVAQIVEPLRNFRLVALTLLANFAVMPLVAVLLLKLLRIDPQLGEGLLLIGCTAGAPLLPRLAQFAKGNVAFAVGAMVLLMVITVGYLPIVLPVLLPGVTVDPWKIARSLILLMLLPLAAAMALKVYFEDMAARVKPVLDSISSVAMILMLALITVVNFGNVLEVFGTRAILTGVLFLALGFGIGWVFGGPGNDTRRVLALGTAQRNVSAALVVGSQMFGNPKVVVMVTVVAIVGNILIPLAQALGRRSPMAGASPSLDR